MQIFPFIFPIFDYIFVCGVLSSAALLSYVSLPFWVHNQDYKTLNNLLTILGSTSYQDTRQNHWNLKSRLNLS